MSHELRTPLNAIMGFSELMSSEIFGPLGSPKYKEYLGDVHQSASHLLAIISDILDLSKIESSTYKIELERIDLLDIVTWAVSLATQKKAEVNAGRAVEIDVAPEARELILDSRAMKQVVLNLVGNALKFTPPEGKIGVSAKITADDGVRITVWDTGIASPKKSSNG